MLSSWALFGLLDFYINKNLKKTKTIIASAGCFDKQSSSESVVIDQIGPETYYNLETYYDDVATPAAARGSTSNDMMCGVTQYQHLVLIHDQHGIRSF